MIKSKSMGDFEFSLVDTKIFSKDIVHVLELSRNLISIAQLSDNGYGIYFEKSGVEIISLKTGEAAMKGKRRESPLSFQIWTCFRSKFCTKRVHSCYLTSNLSSIYPQDLSIQSH